ncbi:uncharacterized protein EV154DRAFT_484393 [Mucor mucedo]|uniref:uncharacterized protein n=1 Tax=Mucor mucedo TaxID=29922 RepID=UPI00221EC7DC|nr:uncharacterized protein EV154DRAFT_484393 [Mucor mucedo]KAI7888200.1 hypothetical protein EV154DRAFT_484393 [Mucor mucedo]
MVKQKVGKTCKTSKFSSTKVFGRKQHTEQNCQHLKDVDKIISYPFGNPSRVSKNCKIGQFCGGWIKSAVIRNSPEYPEESHKSQQPSTVIKMTQKNIGSIGFSSVVSADTQLLSPFRRALHDTHKHNLSNSYQQASLATSVDLVDPVTKFPPRHILRQN